LLLLVDAGVTVSAAAVALGVSRGRAYVLLRRAGRPAGRAKTAVGQEHRAQVLAVFAERGSVASAARAAGLSHSAARRILVEAGLIAREPAPCGKSEARARFFELLAQGRSSAAAAREAGVHRRTAQDWRRGVKRSHDTRTYPDGTVVDSRNRTRYFRAVDIASTPEPIEAGRYLTLDQRLQIADGLVNRHSLTAIAASIDRNKSTVSREVRAHRVGGVYLPHRAHDRARAARARPKTCKLAVHTELRERVQDALRQEHSPEQISRRLRRDFPHDESMRVSHETIYQALYFQARGGLKRELVTALRTGRARRKPQRRPDERRPRFVQDMVMISERPAEVADRAVPGHWEGDLIMGQNNQSAIATLVERATRYTMLVHLPNGHNAEHVRDQLLATITTLPQHLRGSLTWDQGCEMAQHRQFTMASDMQVYFCDPASPWQRGTNENTNGLLRQYFPKGSDLSAHGPEDLEHVAQKLNGRPRKTLDWETPAERLRDLLTTT
jgi:IS30 family transposase/lambda repressor-like predicted transcriptional regulator